MITLDCTHCRKRLQAPDQKAGGRAKCPHCGEKVQVPRKADEASWNRFVEEVAADPDAPVVSTSSHSKMPESRPVAAARSAKPDASEDTGPILDRFLGICSTIGAIVALCAFAVGSKGFTAIRSTTTMSFFLGLAIFATACLFAPTKTLSNPKLASIIGTSNPTKARVACAIAAILFWPIGLMGILEPFLNQK